MTKAQSFWIEYKKLILFTITAGAIGFLGGKFGDFIDLPSALTTMNNKLLDVEKKQEVFIKEQSKIDEHQDIEIRLNATEINQIKVDYAEINANMNHQNELMREMKTDIKKILNRSN